MTSPQQFRKIPVVVSAMRWNGTSDGATAIINWVLANGGTARYHDQFEGDLPPHIAVDTLDATARVFNGDWMMFGTEGEFYPCKGGEVAPWNYEIYEDHDPPTFEEEIRAVLNRHSIENNSDTPDHILAHYVKGALELFAVVAGARDDYYSFHPWERTPADADLSEPPPADSRFEPMEPTGDPIDAAVELSAGADTDA